MIDATLGRGEGPGGAGRSRRCLVTVGWEPTMEADLDLLCISVYCTADDLLPQRRGNGRRRLTDAEVVTLCVAQVLIGFWGSRLHLACAADGTPRAAALAAA